MVERGPEGWAKLPEFPEMPPVSLESLFRTECFLLGLTDPGIQARLWQDRQAQLAADLPGPQTRYAPHDEYE